jgi:hypothetical protein
MSRVFTIVGGLSVLVLWVIVAMSMELPVLNLSPGGTTPFEAFLVGFMLIPKVFGQLLLIGTSVLV